MEYIPIISFLMYLVLLSWNQYRKWVAMERYLLENPQIMETS